MATWDDNGSDSSELDSEEHADVAFMATASGISSEKESDPK
jgi:hypothetical protein